MALVRTPSGQWVCFDDEQVNAVTESQVRSAASWVSGYLLGSVRSFDASRSTRCQTAAYICSTVCCSEAGRVVCNLR